MSIEQELKLLLKENTYHTVLKSALNINSKMFQENFYFDTKNLDLEKRGITLRIRKENEDWLVCLKVKNTSQITNTYVSSLEFEQPASSAIFDLCKEHPPLISRFLPTEGLSYLNDLNNDLELIGSIKNTRYSLQLFKEFNYKFELDHSFFPNGNEAFELEIEGIQGKQDSLKIIENIKNLGIEYTLNSKSKYKRFVEALQ